MYGLVPPAETDVTCPSLPPLQITFATVLADIVSTAGCVIVMLAVPVQPWLSFTFTVYVPATNPLTVDRVPPEGVHAYVYGPTPPLTVEKPFPLLPPLHSTLPVLVALTTNTVGCVIAVLAVAEHPLMSFTVIV